MNITKQFDYQRWLAALVAAGTDVAIVESAAIDCVNMDRIAVFLNIGGTAVQNGTVKFYMESCATAAGVYAAIPGATIGTHTHGGSGETAKTYMIDSAINNRYVKIVYQRETQNTELQSGIALLYAGKKLPVDLTTAYKESVVV